MRQKGFTLIELLIVIAIIAILAVVVILTLNPAQLLAQSRDSTRISDMATLKSAISFYLADQSSLTANALGSSATCYASTQAGSSTVNGAGCSGRLAATEASVVTTTALAAASTTGTGWIPINFAAISSGSPLGKEPVDPTNNSTLYYVYATNASPNYQFKLATHMESTKYEASGTADVESTDGGISSTMYETGTNLTL